MIYSGDAAALSRLFNLRWTLHHYFAYCHTGFLCVQFFGTYMVLRQRLDRGRIRWVDFAVLGSGSALDFWWWVGVI